MSTALVLIGGFALGWAGCRVFWSHAIEGGMAAIEQLATLERELTVLRRDTKRNGSFSPGAGTRPDNRV